MIETLYTVTQLHKRENIVEPVYGESASIIESLPDSIETEPKITFELNEKFDNFTSLEKIFNLTVGW